MKTIPYLIAAATALALVTGCVTSLNPIYNEDDLIFDPALLGVWSEEGSEEIYEVTRYGDLAYTLVFTDEDCKRGTFVMHLAQIEGMKFLDVYPTEPELNTNDFYKLLLIPVHSFFRIEHSGRAARVWTMENEWLEQYLEADAAAIEHVKRDNTVLLTASTKEVQSFQLKHVQTPGAFGEPPGKMRRLTPEEAESLAARCG